MARYLYTVVRCVPDPRTGEFINIGAIAGDPESGDWSVRQVSNESRVRKLAGLHVLEAVHGFLARVGGQIDQQLSLLDEGTGEPLGAEWLSRLFHDYRNVVQLSPPAPILADDAEAALDIIFDRLLIDPVSQHRGFVTKHRVLSEVRKGYRRAQIDNRLVHQRVEVFVGDRVHTPVDFAVANGVAVQLTQAWSFQQKASVQEVSIQVKAWGYALRRLRDGEDARIIDTEDRVSTVSKSVDIHVVVASPKTQDQKEVYSEAQQVFRELEVAVHALDEVDVVGTQAAELLRHLKH